MPFTKRTNAYFFRGTAPINPNVKGPNGEDLLDNMQTNGVPSQTTMEDFAASHLSFCEDNDRAKQSTGVEINKDLVGHVQVHTDIEAKAFTTGLEATTTKVVHAQQLPQSSQHPDTTAFNGITGDAQAPAADIATIEVNIDPAISTRNSYRFKFTDAFRDWINGIIGNLTIVNTYVFGTGGEDNPAQGGTGLGGAIYGPGGTAAVPTAPSILTSLYGPTGVPSASSSLVPLGTILMYPVIAPPNTDWLVCQGQAINRTTYAALFALIDVQYGIGDGATTFNLPDLRAKFVAGYSGSGDYTPTGNTAGADTVALTAAETAIKGHGHTDNIGVDITGITVETTNSEHQHKIASTDASAGGDDADITNVYENKVTGGWNNRHVWTGQPNAVIGGGNDTALNGNVQGDFIADGQHGHDIGGSAAIIGGVTTNPDGADGSAHENRPAFIVLNHIMKVQ